MTMIITVFRGLGYDQVHRNFGVFCMEVEAIMEANLYERRSHNGDLELSSDSPASRATASYVTPMSFAINSVTFAIHAFEFTCQWP